VEGESQIPKEDTFSAYAFLACNLRPFPIANSLFSKATTRQAAYLLGQALAPPPTTNIRQLSHIWPTTLCHARRWLNLAKVNFYNAADKQSNCWGGERNIEREIKKIIGRKNYPEWR
jgi:hypothetical protein